MQGIIRSHIQLAEGIYRLEVEGGNGGAAGQFYMLRCWGNSPLLSRPLSIHDRGAGTISFLYRVHGSGTRLLSGLRPGDRLELEGPYGNGFPQPRGATALVGGGMGIAPLLLAARDMPEADLYLGFSGEPFALSSFREVRGSSRLTIVRGGTVLDVFDPARYETICSCGPVPMMEELARRTAGTGIQLYVSVEKRMACGVGACNGCAVDTFDGIRKACSDGPVFPAGELVFHELAEL